VLSKSEFAHCKNCKSVLQLLVSLYMYGWDKGDTSCCVHERHKKLNLQSVDTFSSSLGWCTTSNGKLCQNCEVQVMLWIKPFIKLSCYSVHLYFSPISNSNISEALSISVYRDVSLFRSRILLFVDELLQNGGGKMGSKRQHRCGGKMKWLHVMIGFVVGRWRIR
jgi:hypothetical protein